MTGWFYLAKGHEVVKDEKTSKSIESKLKRLIYYCLLFGWELDVVDDDRSDIILRRDTD